MKNEKLKNKGLLKIDNLNLIKRYNQALKKLCSFETKLTEFHIDATGYSPEIAEEIGSKEYLNLNRTNRLFILLNLKQSELSVLDLHFTSSEHLYKEFIEDNRQELFTLTSLSVVYGEFENYIIKIHNIEDIIDTNQIEFHIYTPNNIVEKAKELNEKIESFIADEKITYDCDEKLQEIIELSHLAGDSRANKFEIKDLNYKTDMFYTSHLGGNYVFLETKIKTIISEEFETKYDRDKKIQFININDKVKIYEFLTVNNLIKQIQYEDMLEKIDVLEDVKNRIVFENLVEIGEFEYDKEYDTYDTKQAIKKNINHIDESYTTLSNLINNLKKDEDVDEIGSNILIYLLEANTKIESEKITIDHLIARLIEFNYTFVFSKNREVFNKRYQKWSDEKKEYVENILLKDIKLI